jgi:8-oxo-dGTP pyrophosphatase MutT (NUDIX family)
MEKHFTATVYILHEDKTLLIKHPKLGKWLPPGGHIETNETPPECARREAWEETGLEVELIKEEHLFISYPNASSFERPFMCLLENIPPFRDQPAHQHMDFIYLGRPIGGKMEAATPLRWFTLQEILELESEVEIFEETRNTVQIIFEKRMISV